VLQDLRFALRLFNRHRSYAAVAVLTMALGVGANTAIFSIADSVLFRPLPFADADRLFVLRAADPKTGQMYGSLSGADVDAAQATGLFDRMATFSGLTRPVFVRRGDGLDRLALAGASIDYVELLGVRPALGRVFDRSDTGTPAVLLTYQAWMQHYGGDPAVVDRVLTAVSSSPDPSVATPPLRVVGVLPPALRLPMFSGADGLQLTAERPGGAGRVTPPLVRLKAGVAAAAAAAQLRALKGAERVPGKSQLRLVGLREELAVRQDPTLWLLLAAAAIVLLVACANLAHLILARGSARTRELAVRAALGGSRGRLVRLLLAEAACIAALGTAAGLLAGYAGFRLLSNQLPPVLAIAASPAFDVRALVFAVVVAVVSTTAFGVLPAVRLSRRDAREGLTLGRLQAVSPRRGRRALVAVEIAICVALVVGAGLVGRSLFALLTQDLGFGLHRLQARFDLPTMSLRRGPTLKADMAARIAFMEARLRDVRAVPGVRAAAIVSAAPFSGSAPDFPLTSDRRGSGGVYSVSSDFIRALGMTLVSGRGITEGEGAAGAPVGVLNERAAMMLCGGPGACVGHVIAAPQQPPRTVIGVVRDARLRLQDAPLPAMYVPFDPALFALGSIVIDVDDTPAAREQLLRALSASKDARVELRSLDTARDRELSPFRFNAVVVGGFAVLTLALAIVGVYGVMTSVVGERMREYGIRIALGATRARINTHVLRNAALPVAAGLGSGLMLAAWASRFIASLLYGVVPLDGVSYAGAAVAVAMCGLFAALVPAVRAGRIDPIVALRAE